MENISQAQPPFLGLKGKRLSDETSHDLGGLPQNDIDHVEKLLTSYPSICL
jgi:hypothetical protein